MATWKEIGMDGGKHVIRHDGSGLVEKLSPEEFAKLQGGGAVAALTDRKKAEALAKDLAAANDLLAEKDASVAKLTVEADVAVKAAKEWQERCEAAEGELVKARATIDELTAANKALEGKVLAGASEVESEKSKVETPDAPEVPTSAISLDDAMTANLDRMGSAKLAEVCTVLQIVPGDTNALTVALIEAERARRREGAE